MLGRPQGIITNRRLGDRTAVTRNRWTMVTVLAVVVALVGATMVAPPPAAAAVTEVGIDFAAPTDNPYVDYGKDQIRIQNPRPEAIPLLNAAGLRYERAFVRLDQWQPGRFDDLDTDPNIKFTLGDTWLQDMNARGVSPWLTQEDLPSWIQPPLNDIDLANYEDLWYRIVLHIKQASPQTEIVEMFNEPNISKFNLGRNDQVNLYVANARVVNRINEELNLPRPGSPELLSGGPSFTFAASRGSTMRSFVDKLYAREDFEEIKPAFFSWHSFSSGASPVGLRTNAEKIRAYLSNSKFNGAWDDVPQWVSAYGQSKCTQNRRHPSAFNMMKHASFFAAAHHQFMEVGIERASLFATSNYRCYDGTVIFPEPVGDGKEIWWAEPSMRTPLYNALELMAAPSGRRATTSVSGTNSLNAKGQGVGAEATTARGVAHALLWNYRSTAASRYHATASVRLDGLAAACIPDDEEAVAVVTLLDDQNGNVAVGDHTDQRPTVMDPITLPPGSVRTLEVGLRNGSVALVEVRRADESSPIPADCDPVEAEPDLTVPGTYRTPTTSVALVPGGAEVTWETVANADRYRVRYRQNGESWSSVTRYDEPNRHVITGLVPGRNYTVAVGVRQNGKWRGVWTQVSFTAR